MERKLTSKERERLIELHRKERDKRSCDRIKAVLAYDDGYSYAEISRLLLLDDETIRRHVKDYFTKNKLAPANGGSESHLDENESQALIIHLHEVTYLYVKDICLYVKKTFDKNYSISGMTKWLKANNFCYKKPHAVPAKADKRQQKQFIRFYEKLKQKTAGKEPIYFADSVHPEYQTQLVYGWIPKGERKELPTTARQPRVNIIGGICLEGHRFLYQQTDKVDADSIACFLVALRKRHPEKCVIHLIWDNAGYHKDEAVVEFAKALAIEIHYLPPYSPNLNPIERLWKLMRERVMYNTYYSTFTEFTDAILAFLKHIGREKNILRARINDSFPILQSPILAS